jgi:hypothetical protein
VRKADSEIADIIALEEKRQLEKIELIASENFVSPAVMATMGSVLTNKYAEGYPGKRYYGGCEYVDMAENLAIERARNCLVQIMLTFSHILEPRLIRRLFFSFKTRRYYNGNGLKPRRTLNTRQSG